ncbi:MAG: DNA methyltransferase [Nitrososphaeria archaeon]
MKQGALFKSEVGAKSPILESLECPFNFLSFKRIRDESFDFRDIHGGTGVYGIHPYPAMFHFMVVRRLIKEFSEEGDLVLDPFMGSGVVGTECLINNRRFVGYDINPLAVMIAKVRSTPLSRGILLKRLGMIEEIYRRTSPELISFPNIHYWFKEDVINDLSKLRRVILNIEEVEIRNFFLVIFSEVIRKVSNAEYSEFKLLRRKKDRELSVIKTFIETSLKNIELMGKFYETLSVRNADIILEERNILNGIPLKDESVNLVITSPPYGDSKTTVAYGQFSRLSLRWLGIEENVDKISLGSKPKNIIYNLPSEILYKVLEKIEEKDEKRAKEVFSFYEDLFNAISLIAKKVKKNGYVCFVVGNRRVKKEELPTDKISADFFEYNGFLHQKTIVRAISNKRMPIENSPTNIKGEKDSTMRYEYIVILRKTANGGEIL